MLLSPNLTCLSNLTNLNSPDIVSDRHDLYSHLQPAFSNKAQATRPQAIANRTSSLPHVTSQHQMYSFPTKLHIIWLIQANNQLDTSDAMAIHPEHRGRLRSEAEVSYLNTTGLRRHDNTLIPIQARNLQDDRDRHRNCRQRRIIEAAAGKTRINAKTAAAAAKTAAAA